MRAGRRCEVLDGLLEEPHGERTEKSEDRRPAEDIHIGHEGRLLLHHAIEQAERAGAGLGAADVMSKVSSKRSRFLLQYVGRNGCADFSLVKSGSPNQRRGGHRDTDGTSDVAQHVEQAGCVAHLLAVNGGGGHGGQWNKHKAESEAGQRDGNEQRVRADIEIDGAEDHGADAESNKTAAEQLPVVDAGTKKPDHG